MRIDMPSEMASAYNSPSQRARVVSESWAAENLYCPCCEADRLQASRANTKVLDYTCLRCRSPFQLKASRAPFAKRVLDGAYTALRDAILSNNTPSLFLLQYDRDRWIVRSLTLIPWFALT